MSQAILYLYIGTCASTITTVYLLFRAYQHKDFVGARIVNILVAMLFLYLTGIYILTISGILSISTYGNYIRPVLSAIMLAPVAISLLHWKNK